MMRSKANRLAVSKAIKRRWKLWRQGKGLRPGAKVTVKAESNGHPTFEATLRERLDILKSQVDAIENYLDTLE